MEKIVIYVKIVIVKLKKKINKRIWKIGQIYNDYEIYWIRTNKNRSTSTSGQNGIGIW